MDIDRVCLGIFVDDCMNGLQLSNKRSLIGLFRRAFSRGSEVKAVPSRQGRNHEPFFPVRPGPVAKPECVAMPWYPRWRMSSAFLGMCSRVKFPSQMDSQADSDWGGIRSLLDANSKLNPRRSNLKKDLLRDDGCAERCLGDDVSWGT